VNIKRGMFRAWVLFSALWAVSFLGLSAPDWYEAGAYWYRGLQIRISKTACPDEAYSCFNVDGPGDAKYFVQTTKNTIESVVVSAVKFGDTHFDYSKFYSNNCGNLTTGPWCTQGRLLVDLTNEKWLVTGIGINRDTKLFTLLAFAVPAGLLALGAAFGWVAKGFNM
jgi:hypothetical protein